MNTNTQELFWLIKSLSRKERIRLKNFASLSRSEAVYFELYEFINSQDEYDEQLIRDHFHGRRFTNNISKAKKYLFEAILDALAMFYYEEDADVQKIQRKITIAHKKGLVNKVLKLIKKGKGIAQGKEIFLFEKSLLEFERKAVLSDLLKADIEKLKAIERIKMELSGIKMKIEEYENLRDLYEGDLLWIRSRITETGNIPTTEVQNLSEILLQWPKDYQFQSSRAELHFIILKRATEQFLGHYKEAVYWGNRFWDLAGCCENLIYSNYTEEYLNEAHQYLLLKIHIGETEGISTLLSEVEALSFEDQRLESLRYFQLTTVKLALRSTKSVVPFNFDRAENIVLFEKHHPHLKADQVIRLCYSLAYDAFSEGDFGESLRWTNKLLQNPLPNRLIDHQCFGRLLHLTSLLKEEEYQSLDNLIPTFEGYIRRKAQFVAPLKIISLIKKWGELSPKGKLKQLEKTQSTVSGLLNDSKVENWGAKFFEYEKWFSYFAQN